MESESHIIYPPYHNNADIDLVSNGFYRQKYYENKVA